jgi:ribosomal protein S18 acetylase RimI-like enzyme
MIQPTRIRAATGADAAGIARVHVDSWRTTYRGLLPDAFLAELTYEARERTWRGILNAAGSREHTFVAERPPGAMLGFASGGPERTGDPAYQGELYAIYVLQPYQGQGLGRLLMRVVATALAEEGLRAMLLWVLADNHPARRFYEALGGRPVREIVDDFGGKPRLEIAYGWLDTSALLADGPSTTRHER